MDGQNYKKNIDESFNNNDIEDDARLEELLSNQGGVPQMIGEKNEIINVDITQEGGTMTNIAGIDAGINCELEKHKTEIRLQREIIREKEEHIKTLKEVRTELKTIHDLLLEIKNKLGLNQ